MTNSKRLRGGDDCPNCNDGWLYVYCSRIQGANRIRYLKCRHCRICPTNNIEVVPVGRRPTTRRDAVVRPGDSAV